VLPAASVGVLMFWAILGIVALVVAGISGIVFLMEKQIDAWGWAEMIGWAVALIIWISLFIWVGIVYSTHVFV